MISLIQLLKEVQGNPKAIILAGAPGAGKSSVLGKIDLGGLKIFNLDDTILALAKAEGFSLNQKDTDAENRSKFMVAMQSATKKIKTRTNTSGNC
jgi:dephospho-CoA kinase